MLRRAGLALCLLLCAATASAHDVYLLDARRATPGPRLELVELPAASGSSEKRYRLQVGPGLPQGAAFGVFTKPFDHGYHEIESGFQLDDSGALVAPGAGGSKRRLDDLVLTPGPYPLGAAWEVALVSSDRAIRLFARVVPHPLVATQGGCKLSLELASHLGDRFLASGSGFPPGEEVQTEQSYSGRQIRKPLRASAEGTLASDPITHRPVGVDRGARYTVKARTCEVSISYDWGEPALIRR
jgi:hypothetical protein